MARLLSPLLRLPERNKLAIKVLLLLLGEHVIEGEKEGRSACYCYDSMEDVAER